MRTCSALLVTVLATLPSGTFECVANGLCGGGGMCSGYSAAPPTPSCSSYSCRPNYCCGSYGCYRARARSSKTYQVRKFPTKGAALEEDRRILQERLHGVARASHSKSISDDVMDEHLARLSETAASLITTPTREAERIDPNTAFFECCEDRKLPDACLAHCSYGAYNKEVLTRMYFKQDGCPIEAMPEMQFCAAQGRNHVACCARNGVTTTLAGEKCLIFCDQTPGRVTPLDLSYASCLDRFESIKACFYHDLTRYFRA